MVKFYVVWAGRTTGVLDRWEACCASVNGFPGAQYKSFTTRALAEEAWRAGAGEKPLSSLPPAEAESSSASSAASSCASPDKYYVVWAGRVTGVLHGWEACCASINGFSGAKYKSFTTQALAEEAWRGQSQSQCMLDRSAVAPALTVDGACNAGRGEYRGVLFPSLEVVFERGPWSECTNNIVEFLAIVHGLKWLYEREMPMTLFSDSAVAISWVCNDRKCGTKHPPRDNTGVAHELEMAECWLRECEKKGKLPGLLRLVHKWDTSTMGEIPADYGRK